MGNQQTDSDNKEIINIDLSARDNSIYVNEQIIHQKELEKAKRLIKERISKIVKKTTNNPMTNGPINESILIEGTRGSGKTSFLNSLKYNLTTLDSQQYNNLVIFDVLDPTLMEDKCHFFITILSLIEEKVCEQLNFQNSSNCYLSNKKDFDAALDELSRGLPSIDESPSKPNYWDDATQILNKGLKDVSSSFNLRKNFEKFLEISLKILGKDAFLLLIDDVDITFSKTWPILETIRKYLCTDKMIVIVSGNFELFSIAVRKVQWKNFGKALLKNEFDKKEDHDNNDDIEIRQLREYYDKYNIYVSELENQYLQKLFKTSNRITLRTLKDIIIDKNTSINLSNGKDEYFSLVDVLKSIFSNVGMFNPSQVNPYLSFLIGASIRTQINFLQNFELHNVRELDGTERVCVDVIDENLVLTPFFTDLINNDVHLGIITTNIELINSEILRFLINSDILFDSYQLQPINDLYSINACLFIFSYYLSLLIKKNPYLILDYAIRIAYIYNISISFDNSDGTRLREVKKLVNYVKLQSDVYLKDISGYITAYRWTGQELDGGTIGLIRYSNKNNKKTSENIVFYEAVMNSGLDIPLKQILLMPYTRSYSTGNKKGKYSYSLFTLLGAIGDIIKMEHSGVSVIDMLNELSKMKKYPMANSSINTFEFYTEKNEIYSKEDIINKSEDSFIIKAIQNWLSYIKSIDWEVSSYIIGKVITRSYGSFENCFDNKQTFAWNMQMFVCNLINSAIIEEAFEGQSEFHIYGINKNNLRVSFKLLKENIEKLMDFFDGKSKSTGDKDQVSSVDDDKQFMLESRSFHLTKFLITCPFLLIYIGNNDEDSKEIINDLQLLNKTLLKKSLQSDFDEEIIDDLFITSVYETLDKINFSNDSSTQK